MTLMCRYNVFVFGMGRSVAACLACRCVILLCWQTEPSHLLQTKLAQPRIHQGGENQEEDIEPVIWLSQTSETSPPVCKRVQWNVWYTKYTHGNHFQH